MGIVAFLFYVVLVVLLGYVAIWVIGTLAPDHPKIIDAIIWVVVVIFVIWTLAAATGLIGYDPLIPRLRR